MPNWQLRPLYLGGQFLQACVQVEFGPWAALLGRVSSAVLDGDSAHQAHPIGPFHPTLGRSCASDLPPLFSINQSQPQAYGFSDAREDAAPRPFSLSSMGY